MLEGERMPALKAIAFLATLCRRMHAQLFHHHRARARHARRGGDDADHQVLRSGRLDPSRHVRNGGQHARPRPLGALRGKTMFDPDEDGFEIAADGTYLVLVRNGTALQRKPGFTGQRTWSTYQDPSSVALYFHPTPSSGTGGYPVFSQGPRKMAVLLRSQSEPTIYVWLGP